MHVLSAAEMQVCDRATSQRFGIPSIELMRAASSAVAAFARRQFPRAQRIAILCGTGNNGGDGMMAARFLIEQGLDITALLLGTRHNLAGDAAVAWHALTGLKRGRVHSVASAAELAKFNDVLTADLIIDAVLGTGFKPPLRDLALAAFEWLQKSSAPVLAVDLPSGWPADETSTTLSIPVFPADAVITFTAPKPAHVFGALTRYWDQPVVVAPIGSPDAAIVSALGVEWAGSSLDIAHIPRAVTANKGNFGHVLVVGGSMGSAGGKAGAPAMTSLAALRAGAGLVTAAVPTPALPLVSSFAPELMTTPLTATRAGQISAANGAAKQLAALTAGKTVLAIGPGLGQSVPTAEFIAALLSATTIPAVIDADALNMLAPHPDRLAQIAKDRTIVLTPHPGEMARLIESTVAEVQANRLVTATSYARRMGVTLVLKGSRTLIAHPDGRVAVNTSGNPGMAKGGSGDVLTGIIAGFLAQFPQDPALAVEAAVYLHGLAADYAVRDADEHTVLATDSFHTLARALRADRSRIAVDGRNGYVWLQGQSAGARS